MATISAQNNDTVVTNSDNDVLTCEAEEYALQVSDTGEVVLGADDSQNDVLGSSKSVSSSNSVVKSDIVVVKHSFTDLQLKIHSAGSVLALSGTYKFNSNYDSSILKEGVKITKSITIIGHGTCIIDGAGLARCLKTCENVKVTLKNVIIRNGHVKNGNGAGLLLSKNVKLTLINCAFKNNFVYNGNGGGLSIAEGDKVVIKNCKFYKNTAKRVSKLPWDSYKAGMGGAIMGHYGITLKIYSSTFKSNTAHVATVLVVSWTNNIKKTSTLYVKKCVFTKNYSNSDGVIYLDEFGKGTIKNCKFTKNKSPNGAGIVKFDSSIKAVIKNCKFYKNTAHSGGGIFISTISSKYRSNVTISKCTFTKNKANYFGGAIFTVYGSVKATKCKFIKNSAGKYGGALYGKFGVYNAYKCTYKKNKAPHGAKVEFVKVKTNIKKGKGVYFS